MDDDEDHQILTKKQPISTTRTIEETKKNTSTLQSIIDSKWESHQNDNDHKHKNFDDEPLPVGNYGTRQRTSSHHSDTQSKRIVSTNYHAHDLDEFEKLEQYAEEHPSMISTASYVEQVVLKDQQMKVRNPES